MTLMQYLEQKDLSPEEFGEIIGTSGQSVRRWLKGEHMRTDIAAKIVKETMGAVSAAEILQSNGAE
jgi:DNA-binding transcriptional regulator YiaG